MGSECQLGARTVRVTIPTEPGAWTSVNQAVQLRPILRSLEPGVGTGVQRKGLAKEIEWTRHGFDNGAGTKITDTVAGELPSGNDLGKEFVCNINEWKRFIVFE